MNKVQAHKLLYGAGWLMILGFCVHVAVDYCQYSSTLNSAPFWVWICANALIWLIPAALAFVAGFVAKKKLSKKEREL